MRGIRHDRGTLLLEDVPEAEVPEGFVFDDRLGLWRGQGFHYRDTVLGWHRAGLSYHDEAKGWGRLARVWKSERVARDYQKEALEAWRRRGRRGIVVLPTGSGKSHLAQMCMADADRDTLVVVPTLDLVGQWLDQLQAAFGAPIGIVGGGVHEIAPITVTTYDSASLHAASLAARFGLVIYDEVHHLPGPTYGRSAQAMLAPFRLGLTATLEREDGAHTWLEQLVGPVVCRREITELAGLVLAPYRTEILTVFLDEADREAYDEAEGLWRNYYESHRASLGGSAGFDRMVQMASRTAEGREAVEALRLARQILQGAPAKLRRLASLLREHWDRRVIIFTQDNATVYEISRKLLIPAITHHTDIRERRAILGAFASGALPFVVTSRVLNEGVDVPEADIAVVLSGTSTVREHVQRLGRILRPREGKEAILYEMVVENSREERTSARRRDHDAYR